MENAHYFLHVTDTHLCFDAETPDTCCTEQALRSLYQTAFAWDHRPAFVLITGDLVHEGTSADYARAKTCCRSWTSSIIRKLIPHWATMISVRTSTALFGDWPLISLGLL